MKGSSNSSTPEEYLAALEEPRKSEVAALDALIRKLAPKLTPFVHSGILAYGPHHYKYASGREIDWFRIGVASRKAYISLYICAGDDAGYVAERYKDALPNADIGRSCVRFKSLADLNESALRKLIREGARGRAMQ